MKVLKLDSEVLKNDDLPPLSITIAHSQLTVIYSDTDLQAKFLKAIKKSKSVILLDFQDGVYERLTIEANIAFYHNWFGC
ncbi:hypothetical protein GCM10011391_37550 [Pullulanibacillus camelliae]|uniref:Uncharacterized protein n=1 Tax=Pullulanibacillus camelliae TaxID=1707096 RepID=A0A8J2YNE0_9BACL|nr:hypothetical protein [Pullulanibacillus camelliae]GGE55072.1 hypothetical protein GCM10011391_37550 [Pullulanibacillus camelliae]